MISDYILNSILSHDPVSNVLLVLQVLAAIASIIFGRQRIGIAFLFCVVGLSVVPNSGFDAFVFFFAGLICVKGMPVLVKDEIGMPWLPSKGHEINYAVFMLFMFKWALVAPLLLGWISTEANFIASSLIALPLQLILAVGGIHGGLTKSVNSILHNLYDCFSFGSSKRPRL